MRWKRVRYDDVEWDRVGKATFVPFIEDRGVVVIPDGGLPSGDILPGEDVVLDAALRIPLQQAGFRRQGTHVFAISDDGGHVAIWLDGERYTGNRAHRRDAAWWTGDAGEVDDELVRLADEARQALTHAEDQADLLRVLEPAYLNADSPQGGSGFGGTIEQWNDHRQLVSEAIHRDGTFLDVGCANGFLMESVVRWCAARDLTIEPYGVDVSSALAHEARRRMPRWANRIWQGDALTWRPPRSFDFVHSLLDFVRSGRRRELVDNLLAFVAPGGRLILSQYGTTTSAREIVEGLGYGVAGETSAPTTRGTPSVWLETS